MSQNVFTPNIKRGTTTDGESQPKPHPASSGEDTMSNMLLTISRSVIVGFIFLLPLFFVPGLWATLGFQKIMLSLGVVAGVLSCLSLLMLRQAAVRTIVPTPWLWFLAFVGVAIVSAVFSEDVSAAFRGDVMETGTVAFIAILAAVMALPLVLQNSKKFTLRALQSVVAGALVLLLYCVTRLFFGPILGFASFPTVTTSPLGGFNDLAVMGGLCVLLSLVALLQLPLKALMQWLLFAVAMMSLVVLSVVNFFFVWLVTGFFGLLMLLYVVSRDRLLVAAEDGTSSHEAPSYVLILATALVCLVSAWFIVMGDVASSQMSRLFGVTYLEVRPSFTATTDVARGVYQEQLLLGVGPNQFVSSWRQHKDPNINETLFWATDFVAGSSYVTTLAVTTGVAGLLALLMFHGWYVWFGLRMLLRSKERDKFWYFVGVVTFAGAAFLWLMSYLYVPGAAILLLAAIFTGLSFVASSALLPHTARIIPLVSNRQRGFGLMAVAILIISGAVGALFTVSEQYMAYATFNKVQATAENVAEIDQAALVAYSQYQDDSFLGIRSRIALLELNQLLSIAEPSEVEQQQFLDVSSRALAIVNEAISDAPENPEHRAIQAALYNNLAMAGIPDALGRSTSSLAAAKELDPANPTYSLVEAQMAVRRGDVETARQALLNALSQKRNFTEALFLLAQLDIAEGNTEAAIETTQAIITLEPNNPTRYYQLGILLTAVNDLEGAEAAYAAALRIDPDYANARYFRALILAGSGQVETAISELQVVLETNQENQQLVQLITQLEQGNFTTIPETDGVSIPVTEPTPQTENDVVTSPVVPDSDLLTPLNTVPGDEEADTEPVESAAVEASAEEVVVSEVEDSQ